MNITIPTLWQPGQQVQVFDPDEPPTEWVIFTVIRVTEHRVELLSPSQQETWAEFSEVIVIDREKPLTLEKIHTDWIITNK